MRPFIRAIVLVPFTIVVASALASAPTRGQNSVDAGVERLMQVVPPALADRCVPYRQRAGDVVVEGAVAAIECRASDPFVDDIGLYLFEDADSLARWWDIRLAMFDRPLSRHGDCLQNQPGIDTYLQVGSGTRADVACFRGSTGASVRWIDSDHLVYGSLDVTGRSLAKAMRWWTRHGFAAGPKTSPSAGPPVSPVPGSSTAPTVSPSGDLVPAAPVASLDPAFPRIPVPYGSVLLNAQADSATPDAYRLAAWESPLDSATATAFYLGLGDDRWLPDGRPITTPLGTDIVLVDDKADYDHATVTISADGPGSLISVRFVPRREAPGTSPAPGVQGDITFAALPRETAIPSPLPAWAIPEGASVLDSAAIGDLVFAELTDSDEPAVVLAAYRRALDDAGIAHAEQPDGEDVVIGVDQPGHPGTIVLTPAGTGTGIALAVAP